MVDFKLPISENPLKTKKDLQHAFLQLAEPLKKFYSPGHAQLRLVHTGASYPENVAFLEGFSRVLWGLAPFLLGGPAAVSLKRHEPYNNNWQFFRVMVDMALAAVDREYDPVLLQRTLDTLDSFYYGEGWYGDGQNAQFDYYIAFAMHFYGLIYGKAAGEHKYLERARFFAKDFIYWFSGEGDALPFGRSLTYRFAQAAFWSAYVYAGGGDEDLGVIKGRIGQ